MNKRYEERIRRICNLPNWRDAEENERNGAIAIACVFSYLNGVKPNEVDIANHLGLSVSEVEVPFKRLLVNGIFSNSRDIKNDKVLVDYCDNIVVSRDFIFTGDMRKQNAWCWIAGIGSGYCGLRE